MHYYQFHIADYRKDTAHLSPIEHYIYRTLIDWYYLDEQAIPKKTQSVMRRLGLGSENEKNLQNVLSDFFEETDSGWIHHRIEREISAYKANAAKNRENGKKGGRPKKQRLSESEKPKKTQPVSSGNPVATDWQPTGNPNERQPITNNHKPSITPPLSPNGGNEEGETKTTAKRGTRLPDDWEPTADYLQAAIELQPTWTEECARSISEQFRDYWIAQPGQRGIKTNWLATWRNWCRRAGPMRGNGTAPQRQQLPMIPAEDDHKALESLARQWGIKINRDTTYRELRGALFARRQEMANAA